MAKRHERRQAWLDAAAHYELEALRESMFGAIAGQPLSVGHEAGENWAGTVGRLGISGPPTGLQILNWTWSASIADAIPVIGSRSPVRRRLRCGDDAKDRLLLAHDAQLADMWLTPQRLSIVCAMESTLVWNRKLEQHSVELRSSGLRPRNPEEIIDFTERLIREARQLGG